MRALRRGGEANIAAIIDTFVAVAALVFASIVVVLPMPFDRSF